jgi:hypothetical protein
MVLGFEAFEVTFAVDAIDGFCIASDVEQIGRCKLLADVVEEGGAERLFVLQIGPAKEQFWSRFALLDAHVGSVADIGVVNLELGVHNRTTISEESGFISESAFCKLRLELLKSVDQQLFKLAPHFVQRSVIFFPTLFVICSLNLHFSCSSFRGLDRWLQHFFDICTGENCNCVQRHRSCNLGDFRAAEGNCHWNLVGADKRVRVVDEQVRVNLHGARQRIHHGRRLLKHVCGVAQQLLPEQLRGIAVLDCEVCWRIPLKVRVDRLMWLTDFRESRVVAQRRIFMLHERALLSGVGCVIRIERDQPLINYLLLQLFHYTEIGLALLRAEQFG